MANKPKPGLLKRLVGGGKNSPQQRKTSSFVQDKPRLTSTFGAAGIFGTPSTLGSSRLSTDSAGLNIKTSTSSSVDYKPEVIKPIQQTNKTSLKKINEIPDNLIRKPSRRGRMTEESFRLEVIEHGIKNLDEKFTFVNKNLQNINENFKLVDKRLDKVDSRITDVVKQFNKIQLREHARKRAESNARSGFDELRRYENISRPVQPIQNPALIKKDDSGSGGLENLLKGGSLAAAGLAGVVGGLVLSNMKKLTVSAASKAFNLGKWTLGTAAGQTLFFPAIITALMANASEIGELKNAIKDAKTPKDRDVAVGELEARAKLSQRRTEKVTAETLRQSIIQAKKDNYDPHSIGRLIVSELKTLFASTTDQNKRMSLVREFLGELESLGLTKNQLEQLKRSAGPGIQSVMDRMEARNRRTKRRMNVGGPKTTLGPKTSEEQERVNKTFAGTPGYPKKTPPLPTKKPGQLDFGRKFERMQIEQQKSQFMKFGQLPPGFEFLPGHMGRLGTPAAVAATGAMPLPGGNVPGFSIPHTGGSPTPTSVEEYKKSIEKYKIGNLGGPKGNPFTHKEQKVFEGPLTSNRRGYVDPVNYYRAALEKLRGSKLIGFVPKDGPKFGIKKGTAEEWARFMTQLTKKESSFNVNTIGDGGESMGLSQMKHGQYGIKDPFNPDQAQSGMIKQFEKYILRSKHVAGRGRGGVKDGVYGGYRGAAAYFGPLRRQHEFFQHDKWMAGMREKFDQYSITSNNQGGYGGDLSSLNRMREPVNVGGLNTNNFNFSGASVDERGFGNKPQEGNYKATGWHSSLRQLKNRNFNPLLAESIKQGAINAFGDPKDKNTRYEIRISNTLRPGNGRSKHNSGRAADLQIWDRKEKKYVGGFGNDIMRNAYGNPHTYNIYQALARGSYQYMHKKYGKETANRLSWGGNFFARQGNVGGARLFGGLSYDQMHYSIDEPGQKGSRGSIVQGAGREIHGHLRKHGVTPARPMGEDIAAWKSPYKNQTHSTITDPRQQLGTTAHLFATSPVQPKPEMELDPEKVKQRELMDKTGPAAGSFREAQTVDAGPPLRQKDPLSFSDIKTNIEPPKPSLEGTTIGTTPESVPNVPVPEKAPTPMEVAKAPIGETPSPSISPEVKVSPKPGGENPTTEKRELINPGGRHNPESEAPSSGSGGYGSSAGLCWV